MADEWITTYNGYFFLTLAGILGGAIHITLRYCFKSDCRKCQLGFIKFERDQTQQSLNRAESVSLP